jgi:hypothetical protein
MPPEPPTLILIYPSPRNDCWRHATYYGAQGPADGSLPIPGEAPPDEARQAAEAMVADHVRTYYSLQCTIDWHPPDAKGWITGDIRNNPLPAGDPDADHRDASGGALGSRMDLEVQGHPLSEFG